MWVKQRGGGEGRAIFSQQRSTSSPGCLRFNQKTNGTQIFQASKNNELHFLPFPTFPAFHSFSIFLQLSPRGLKNEDMKCWMVKMWREVNRTPSGKRSPGFCSSITACSVHQVRQGTSPKYQLCYLDLVIWYWDECGNPSRSLYFFQKSGFF